MGVHFGSEYFRVGVLVIITAGLHQEEEVPEDLMNNKICLKPQQLKGVKSTMEGRVKWFNDKKGYGFV